MISALAEENSSEKRRPENWNARLELSLIPRVARAFTASGRSPSPQGLSMGGWRESKTVTRKPRRAEAMAVAIPAGPEPTTATSESIGARPHSSLPPQKNELGAKSGTHCSENAQGARLGTAV